MDTSPIGWVATITAIVVAVIGVLVAFGVPVSNEIKVSIVALLAALSPVGVWYFTRHKTTPLADPRDDQGVELVRKTDSQPPLQAQRRKAKNSAA